jgi:hypothetical protein
MTALANLSRLLVGVDFDDASASALQLAGALADAGEIDLTAFHAATLEVPAYFTTAHLIVLSMPVEAGPHPQFGAIVQVLTECVHPVLFVPSPDGTVERSQS